MDVSGSRMLERISSRLMQQKPVACWFADFTSSDQGMLLFQESVRIKS